MPSQYSNGVWASNPLLPKKTSADGESSHPLFCDGAANAGTAWAPGAKHLLWAFHVLEERRFLQHPCRPRKAKVGRRLVAAVHPDKSGIRRRIHSHSYTKSTACQMPEDPTSRNQAANPLRYSRNFRFAMPKRQHPEMGSILHQSPSIWRNIPGIRARNKCVLENHV
ncbi:hypothetical protein ACQKWADRAFT_29185 [Trichoderma austrokoningii]